MASIVSHEASEAAEDLVRHEVGAAQMTADVMMVVVVQMISHDAIAADERP